MKIKRLKLKNIRSYDFHEIEFPDGSLLLSGDVGSGKTSLLLAIEYALFGLQPGQTGSSLLRNNSSFGEVILHLEIEGRDIIIERKLKRGKTVTNDYAAISINGEKVECSITELKTKIIGLLGYPSEFIKKNNLLYKYTVYTPQENMKQIILEDSEIRLSILRHIFGIDKYKNIRENLVLLLNKIKEDTKVLSGEIKTLDSDKARLLSARSFARLLEEKIFLQSRDLNEKISSRKKKESEVQALELKVKEKEKFELELEKAKVLLASKRDQLSSIPKELKELEAGISLVTFNEQQLLDITSKIAHSVINLDSLNSGYISLLSEINALSEKRIDNISKKDRIFKMYICPTCLQDVLETHKHNIMNAAEGELSQISKSLSVLNEKKLKTSESIEKEKNDKSMLEEQKISLEILKSKALDLEKDKKKINTLEKLQDSLNKDILLLEKHLDSLKQNIFEFSKFNSLFNIKQGELKLSFKLEKESEISLAELKKELELTHREIYSLDLAVLEKEKAKQKLMNLLELNDWLSTHFLNLINFTERNVMLKLRLEFSKLFSKWFQMVAGDSFFVQLDENFTPLIMHHDIEMDYSFLSGGERTAVALAYRLALNQTINSMHSQIKTSDIVILDEPTDGFSDAQIDKIRDVLRELNVSQLIIVSHEQKIEGFVDSIIKLKKEGDTSFVESTSNLNIPGY